jgi:hypothetical protein
MSRLDPGRYKAKILYHTVTENSAGNTDLRITVLPFADAQMPLPLKYKPTPVTIFMTITDGTMGTIDNPGWVLLTLKHLGFHSADLATLHPDHEMAHTFTGREVVILGSEDEYRGRKRIRWNILRNEAESKPAAVTKLSALSDRYAKQLETLIPPPDKLFGPGENDKPPF